MRRLHGEKIAGFPRVSSARRVPLNIRLDEKTVAAMVRIYCRAAHRAPRACCPDCVKLLEYARARLDHCPFGRFKTTCANCPVHCYRPAERDLMRRVMRLAGPRMLFRHPWLTLWHACQSFRGKPRRP